MAVFPVEADYFVKRLFKLWAADFGDSVAEMINQSLVPACQGFFGECVSNRLMRVTEHRQSFVADVLEFLAGLFVKIVFCSVAVFVR